MTAAFIAHFDTFGSPPQSSSVCSRIAKAPLGNPTKIYGKQTQIDADGKRSTVSKLNDGPVIKVDTPPEGKTYYEVDGELFVQLYARIMIRRKSAANGERQPTRVRAVLV